jgi:hypothetical protein
VHESAADAHPIRRRTRIGRRRCCLRGGRGTSRRCRPGGETSTVSFPAGEYCPFPIQLTLVNNEKPHDTGQGVVVYTGAASGTVTNLTTGATHTYNLSGPGSTTAIQSPDLS